MRGVQPAAEVQLGSAVLSNTVRSDVASQFCSKTDLKWL